MPCISASDRVVSLETQLDRAEAKMKRAATHTEMVRTMNEVQRLRHAVRGAYAEL